MNAFNHEQKSKTTGIRGAGSGVALRRQKPVFDKFCPQEFHQLQPSGARHSDDDIIMHCDVTLKSVGGHQAADCTNVRPVVVISLIAGAAQVRRKYLASSINTIVRHFARVQRFQFTYHWALVIRFTETCFHPHQWASSQKIAGSVRDTGQRFGRERGCRR